MRGIQENMHVHYSNTVINILRVFETHILTCYRPTLKRMVSGAVERPRSRACSRTTHGIMIPAMHPAPRARAARQPAAPRARRAGLLFCQWARRISSPAPTESAVD
jgi:hypothetical protein